MKSWCSLLLISPASLTYSGWNTKSGWSTRSQRLIALLHINWKLLLRTLNHTKRVLARRMSGGSTELPWSMLASRNRAKAAITLPCTMSTSSQKIQSCSTVSPRMAPCTSLHRSSTRNMTTPLSLEAFYSSPASITISWMVWATNTGAGDSRMTSFSSGFDRWRTSLG